MEQRQRLTIARVKGTVEVETVALVFYRLLHNGTVLKQRRGRWLLPAKGSRADTVEVRARGFVPGFQRLFADGEQVHDFGAHVSLAERIVIFAPFLLIAILPWLGLPVGLIMFFMNVTFVKNPAMPRALRIAVPIINTLAMGVIFAIFRGWI